MNWHAIFYDFKRTLLKPSILSGILLITFLGIGILLLLLDLFSSALPNSHDRQIFLRAFMQYLLLGISIFSFFFPFIIIYITFTTFVKPRSDGNLQFILVKPITRIQLMLVRFISGVLIIIISTVSFILLSALVIQEIGNIEINFYDLSLAILGILTSQISFYSLTYFLASLIKNTITYLGITTGIYIILLVIGGILGLVSPSLSAIYSYINPLSLSSLIMYSINPILTFKPLPYLIIISSILWIVVPIYLASEIYERTDYP
ncbi:MAG: ABC transporter permease subunit [Saccharolobus sp.]